jgi:DNA (cytosine-5)-methyltransferase 1
VSSAFSGPVERFRLIASRGAIERVVARRDGSESQSYVPLGSEPLRDRSQARLAERFDGEFLRTAVRPRHARRAREVRVADLFAGCGVMSLGLWEACRAVSARMVPVVAVDFNEVPLAVYRSNFPEALTIASPIERLVDGELGAPVTATERALLSRIGRVDVLIGGPPCQGHSNLNNHTRRRDSKNALYARMARFAEIAQPTHVVIENVTAVRHDRGRVVDRTITHLRALGYAVDDGVVEAVDIGVAQRRRRHLVVASRDVVPNVASMNTIYERPERSVMWAIGDLERATGSGEFDRASTPSATNAARIERLFRDRLYDLPNEARPDCHRLRTHTYKSVYGRLRPDVPAQTITSGFLSMGQGRYVHPTRRRLITPHEAARLQFVPDFFDFSAAPGRTALAEMIGNAVPSKLAYVVGLELLR